MASQKIPYRRSSDHRVGLREFRPSTVGQIQVLAIPYAGGQSLAYRPLATALPLDWGFVGVDPPGHAWASPPALESVHDMAELYDRECKDHLHDRTLLVGTSLGGSVAFQLAATLESQGRPAMGVVVVGTPPPHRRGEYLALSALDDERLVATLVKLGGIPAEWVHEREMLEFFLPALKADLVAFESFETRDHLDHTPYLAIAGNDDELCRAPHLEEWVRYATKVETHLIPGGHFVAQSQPKLVSQILCQFADRIRKTT